MGMENNSFILLFWFLALISFLNTPLSHGMESISGNKYITLGESIVSLNERFELGFFKPGQSSNYYVGIWYKNILPQVVVWLANRVTPIPSTAINSTKLRILDGNLVLVDRAQNRLWSTNINSKRSSVFAILGEDGNLALIEDGINSRTTLWQSFDHPTHTFLPGSKFGYNKRTRTKQVFTSWKSPDDPTPGLFSLDNDGNSSFHLWNGTEEYWNSGPKFGYGLLHWLKPNPGYNITIVDNENESYISYFISPSVIARTVIDINGQHKTFTWLEAIKNWVVFDVQPAQDCDVYAYCGPFGVCTHNSTVGVCDCLHGFKHKSEIEWGPNGGCVRMTNLKCGANYQVENMDRFKMYPNMRLPRHPQNMTTRNQAECQSTCLKNCSCTAYAYSNSSGYCSFWFGQLLNLKQLGKDDGNGSTIYIRLAASELSNVKDTHSKNLSGKLKIIIPSAVVAAVALLSCSIGYICCRRRTSALRITENAMDQIIDEENDEDGIDVQFFSFESILEATDNFSDTNKLGNGGFGPVYKGTFPEGQEIAVKRLSTKSAQGIKEFKNEVILIAKLQHRNLVKLVGYCMQAREKILLYEYMPNKSLDSFIFHQSHRLLLDWSKRFEIILGIARGLLYLHHDSRLRIIHRDLKPNNILLDEEMTSKISDFGLARMVAENTLEANTKNVVGTYGYMSPEYALSGLFSIKSDVFSFGVIILEIVSGKKNTSFYQHEEVSNLLGYAWKLWNDGNVMDLVDDSLQECCNKGEVLKCINVALLCVEEDPNCRPTMPNVLLMLADESMVLPRPNQPAFVTRSHASNDSATIGSDKPCSNMLTISVQEGR